MIRRVSVAEFIGYNSEFLYALNASFKNKIDNFASAFAVSYRNIERVERIAVVGHFGAVSRI